MQVSCVQLASLFLPLVGHVHVLHPSEAVNKVWGQQWPSSIGFWGGSLGSGAGHSKLVQFASLFKPLSGHMHVFKPSPAG